MGGPLMEWLYKNSPYTPSEDVQGFVYLITNLTTGKKYIGKKNFWRTKKLPPLKGKVNKRHSQVTSDWATYYGSSDSLSKDVAVLGEQYFSRTILKLCANKTMMSYWETKLQFEADVLSRTDYYNEFISCRINSTGFRL
tara:strand:- start:3 stop:419 length:417 start_codon:yes stop_codon:yes gene_type:complete